MGRISALLLGILVTTAVPSGGQQPAVGLPTFSSESSELVVLPVTVTDREGRYLSGLDRHDFAVFDNDRLQPIAFFSNEDTPVSVALVIDNSASMRGHMGELIAATVSFARWSHPEDEVFVVAFNDSVTDALGGRPISASDHRELESSLLALKPDGRTALYSGIMDGLEHLERARHARRVVVVISDGGDNASRATLDDVLRRARQSNVTIYTIGLFDERSRDRNPGVLKRLAETTGGERYLPESAGPLLQACDRIARDIRSGYTVGYVPPDRDGAFHRVRVQVTAPEARRTTVRTRPGYFAANAPQARHE
jgi:Ca-activated chloride channel family protein